MPIQIRPFQHDDVPHILEIVNYHILQTTAIYDYDARTLEEQIQILKNKSNNNFPFLVAESDLKIVGFGTFDQFRFKKAYQFTVEHSVYVHPNFQGFGIGKLLLSELISIAKTQKIHTMIAVIDSANQNSVDFHTRFGFKTVGIIKESGFKFNTWLDSILMQLILN